MSQYILALDQGTTSSRAIAFDRSGNIAALSQQSLPQHYPQAGWVEHDPLEIWDTQRRAAAEVIARLPEGSVAGIGVTNQRETTILWDKATGEPVYNAIVWQCRRTAELCEELKRRGLEERIRSATGLLIDAYFSGSKIRWILDNVPGVRRRAERGEVLFGTVESWLIWKLTGRHVTDYANASRTMLFDIHRLAWDEELCGILGVPTAMLPQPVPNSAVYGTVQPSIPGLESLAGVPVCGAAGDQQSALFGQTCFAPGEAKNTYGTGCFTLMNVGEKPVRSRAGLLTSVAWQVDGKTTYALEGSVFNAGSTIQWLRDELGIISSAPEIDVLAAAGTHACVIFGDSTVANELPRLLAARLRADGIENVSVTQAAIKGDRLVADGVGRAAKLLGGAGVKRFSHDVLAQAGADMVLVKLGANDLIHPHCQSKQGLLTPVTFAQMTAGYRALADMAHAQGVRIWFCELTPWKGYTRNLFGRGDDIQWSPEYDALRLELNAWFQGADCPADGYIPLDALADPNDPDALVPAYTTDGVHHTPAGQRALAALIPEDIFRETPKEVHP